MADKLKRLFDYQRFEGNSRLQKLIGETEARAGAELSDDQLELVAAAGENRGDKQDQLNKEIKNQEVD